MKPEDLKELTPIETAIMMDLHNWFSGALPAGQCCRAARPAAHVDLHRYRGAENPQMSGCPIRIHCRQSRWRTTLKEITMTTQKAPGLAAGDNRFPDRRDPAPRAGHRR